jgi:hypothetical protein
MKDQDYGIITANSVSGGRFMGTYEMKCLSLQIKSQATIGPATQ